MSESVHDHPGAGLFPQGNLAERNAGVGMEKTICFRAVAGA